ANLHQTLKLTRCSTSPGHESSVGCSRGSGSSRYPRLHRLARLTCRSRSRPEASAQPVNRLLTNPFIGVVTTNPQIRILPPTRLSHLLTVQGDDVVTLH